MPGGKSSPPDQPDYIGAANATAQGQLANTLAAYSLNNPNTVSPYGSVTYSNPFLAQGGGGNTSGLPAPSYGSPSAPTFPSAGGVPGRSGIGGGFGVPNAPANSGGTQAPTSPGSFGAKGGFNSGFLPGSTTQSINLSPEQQRLYEGQTGIRSGLIGAGQSLADDFRRTGGQVDQSIIDRATAGRSVNEDVANALYRQRTQYLDPQFSQQEASLEGKLRAQGLQPGTEAYDNALANFGRERQSAYSDAADAATQAGVQAGYLGSQQDINALGAAQSASNFSLQQLLQLLPSLRETLPPTQGTQGVGAPAGPDLLGTIQAGYNSALGASNAQNASSNQFLGTLGQLGALGYLAFCWVAYAVFGPEKEFAYAKLWVQYGWRGPIADAFRKFYKAYGLGIALFLNRHTWLKPVVRPFFAWAARKGKQYADRTD